MGTGKTFTALAALCELPPGKVLIAAPKRVLDGVWKTDKNYDLSKHDVTYMNYEKISRDKTFSKLRFDYIILDEVHRLKGQRTKISLRFQNVTRYAKYVWGLTGTPQANNYADVYCIYRNMSIIEFDMSYNDFVRRYYITRSMESSSGFNFQILIAPRKETLSELLMRIGKHSSVKRLRDCIDLPEKRIDIVYIPKMVTPQYKELMLSILRNGEDVRTMTILEKINKLHQAANGFLYQQDNKTSVLIPKNQKFEILNEMLEDMLEETERVIVVYYYHFDLEQLKTLPFQWTTDVTEFPNKQVLLLQFGQCEGLNLQYCDHMIYYSYDYSFLKFDQMSARIYRPGQKNNVIYTVLISKNTIEEKIWAAIKNKKSTDEFLKEALSDE